MWLTVLEAWEVGKDADIVIWNGHPFDLQSKVEKTLVNGEIVFSL